METQRELDYNLACAHTDANQQAAAAAIFARLWAARPDEHRYGAKLLAAQLALGRFKLARATLEQLRENRKKYAREAVVELKAFREKHQDVKPADLKPPEQQELRRLSSRARLTAAPMLQMEAMLLLAENKPAESLAILTRLEKAGRASPDFLVQLGRCALGLRRWTRAASAFTAALKLDPDHAQAHHGRAQIALAQRRNFEAAEAALTSVGLLYHNPSAHFLLGVALHRLGRIDRAVEALRVCVAQNPNFLIAHRRLAMIYTNRLKDPAKAQEHREKFAAGLARLKAQRAAVGRVVPNAPLSDTESDQRVKDNPPHPKSEAPAPSIALTPVFDPAALAPPRADAPFAVIVSGLPRSGTSLMMQMLVAGGVPALHDAHRPADDDNPHGYFEFTPAKNLRADVAWLPHAKGRVLKLVAQLLPFLPPGFAAAPGAFVKLDYRLIFMERSLDEVQASQQVMLDRHGRAGAALTPEKLRAVYTQQLDRVAEVLERRQLPVLRLAHRDAIHDPAGTAARVADFLELPLDRGAMAAAIDPKLHRQRKT